MSLPPHLHGNLVPSELMFLAENHPVTIIPKATMKKLGLVGDDLPPLRANRRVQIPLWLALLLKLRDKCRIVPPEWLNYEYLKNAYDDEKANPKQFTSKLPDNWMEISKIILARAPDDVGDSVTAIKQVLQDLREIRLLKVNNGLRELNESNFTLTGLSMMEVNEMRPFVVNVMNQLRLLDNTKRAGEGDGDMEMEDDYD